MGKGGQLYKTCVTCSVARYSSKLPCNLRSLAGSSSVLYQPLGAWLFTGAHDLDCQGRSALTRCLPFSSSLLLEIALAGLKEVTAIIN